MERYSWDALPTAVHDAVLEHVGPVTVLRDVAQGQNCNVALVLRSSQGDIFLKGVRGISRQMRWLRNEAAAGELAPGLAPAGRLSLDIDADDRWFVVGFDFIDGRPADLSPGSADLEVVGATVTRLGALTGGAVPPLRERWSVSDWWTKLAVEAPEQVAGRDIGRLTDRSRAAATLVDGDALLHTDLHEHQFMITPDGSSAQVIDWGRPASGAPWVDTAFLVVRLIAAGHDPGDAETWAESVPWWSSRSDEAGTAFACYVAGLWSYRAATTPFPGSDRLGAAARTYAGYRLAC